MRMKILVFLSVFLLVSVFVLPSFPAATTNSGSGSMSPPSVKFKSWLVGRSAKNTDSTNDNPTSFITSTETACHFTASVVYNGNQGDSVSPIDPLKVTWSVENPSHGMTLVTSEKNWSGSKHLAFQKV